MTRYLAKFFTSSNTSYMMDIFLEEEDVDIPLNKALVQHTTVANELVRNKNIIKIQFFEAIPSLVWER